MAKAEKLAKVGLVREGGWLYYIDKNGNVARSRKVAPGQATTEKPEVLAKTAVTRDNNYIYFMDEDGDVARVARSKVPGVGVKSAPVEEPAPILRHGTGDLRDILVSKIVRNPENPRLLFRQAELDQLTDSIARHGIQVPVVVYLDKGNYVLIDGERRWRSAIKLNMSTLPAVVQEKPTDLDNLLLMFNIHALREQWDLLTIALKLPKVEALLTKKFARPPTEGDVSIETGLSRAVVRRCRLLSDLPSEYKATILDELSKPKGRQKLTEDFFIEMERALKTVQVRMPDAIHDIAEARRVLLQKFKDGVIVNRTHFRMVSKIARAENVASDATAAKTALQTLFTPNEFSIENAYAATVSDAYLGRDIFTRIDSLTENLDRYNHPAYIDPEVREKLLALFHKLRSLLEGDVE